MFARLTPRVVPLLAYMALLVPVARGAAQGTPLERWLLVSDEPGASVRRCLQAFAG